MTVGELNLIKELDPKNPNFNVMSSILSLFENESIFSAIEILEGFSYEVDLWIRESIENKPLKSLKATFYDTK